jgi:hypothetical protein
MTSMAESLGGIVNGSGSVRHQVLKSTSMAGPLGALPASLTASTPEVEDYIDGGPLGGRCQQVWQCPPLSLKRTSLVGPLGGAIGRSDSVRYRVLKTTSIAGPWGGAADGSGSIHHRV